MRCIRREVVDLIEAVRPLWRDQEGVTSVEYIVLLSVIGIAALVAFGQLSEDVRCIARKSSDTLERAAGMDCYNGQ